MHNIHITVIMRRPNIPWSEWGPENSRLFCVSDPLVSGYYAFHGSRYVVLDMPNSSELNSKISTLTVVDFTPNLAAWQYPTQLSTQQQINCDTKVVGRSEPNIVEQIGWIADGGITGLNIVTRLPYQYSQRKLDTPIHVDDIVGLIVDDEHIILASISSHSLVVI
jgi:hypothetical protein